MSKHLAAGFALVLGAMPVLADEPPQFMRDTFPQQGLAAAWEQYKAVYAAPDAALAGKTKQLIALGVAAQIPCEYCVFAHSKRARDAGATDDEIKEALAVAALVRMWSTMLNGSQYSMEDFQAELGGAPAETN